jgi:hypothetical protein
MKYGLQCAVTSKIRLSEKLTTTWDEFELELSPSSEGFWADVAIIASGSDVGTCETVLSNSGDAQTIAVNPRRNELLHAKLVGILQTLESFFGLYGGLENVHWNDVEAFFELDAGEGTRLTRLAIMTWPELSDYDFKFSPPEVEWILAKAKRCQAMTTTLSFYREGLNDVRQRRNISAFFNFYFVLEGLYGNGKTKNDQVKYEFRQNATLTAAIDHVISGGFPASMDGDEGIREWLQRIAKPCNPEGIIHLVVEARGNLHHNTGTNKSRGSPLMNERFLSLSQLALRIVQAVLPVELDKLDPPA